MAGEIQCAHLTGKTLYALVRNSTGSVWQTTTSTFVSYTTANLANYTISLTEQGTASGYYAGTFPAAAAGTYAVAVYERAGGSAAEGDVCVAVGNVEWDGSAVIPLSSRLAPATSGRTLAVDTDGRVDLGSWRGSTPAALSGTYVQVDCEQWKGGTISTPNLTGIPKADLTAVGGQSVLASHSVNFDYLDEYVSSRLAPTVSGRTLDVTSTGAAGIDWGNVENPVTVINFSGTSIKTATDVEADTQDLQSRLPAALVGGRMDASMQAAANGVITAAVIATGAIDADALAADATAEVAAAVLAGTVTEISAVPAASPTLAEALAFLYMGLRNKLTCTASQEQIHNGAGAVVATAALSDDGTTFTREEFA